MLKINDLDKLKITKVVEDYKIFFSYANEKFLLLLSDIDCESRVVLYKRIPQEKNGLFNVEQIACQYDDFLPILKYIGKKMCYSKIDLKHFVLDLAKRKLIQLEMR